MGDCWWSADGEAERHGPFPTTQEAVLDFRRTRPASRHLEITEIATPDKAAFAVSLYDPADGPPVAPGFQMVIKLVSDPPEPR